MIPTGFLHPKILPFCQWVEIVFKNYCLFIDVWKHLCKQYVCLCTYIYTHWHIYIHKRETNGGRRFLSFLFFLNVYFNSKFERNKMLTSRPSKFGSVSTLILYSLLYSFLQNSGRKYFRILCIFSCKTRIKLLSHSPIFRRHRLEGTCKIPDFCMYCVCVPLRPTIPLK